MSFTFLYCVFFFVFVLCLVYQMLPVSMDCPFLISVFSNVYLEFKRVVLSILITNIF
jgi:hypothetical protein